MSNIIVLYQEKDKLIAVHESFYEIRTFEGWKDSMFDTYSAGKLLDTVNDHVEPNEKHAYTIASYLFYGTGSGFIDNCTVIIPLTDSICEGFVVNIINSESDIDFYYNGRSIRLLHIGTDAIFHTECKKILDEYFEYVKVCLTGSKFIQIEEPPKPMIAVQNSQLEIDSNGTITLNNEKHFWNNDTLFEIIPGNMWYIVMDVLNCITKSM
jgi:hypothetical protein